MREVLIPGDIIIFAFVAIYHSIFLSQVCSTVRYIDILLSFVANILCRVKDVKTDLTAQESEVPGPDRIYCECN